MLIDCKTNSNFSNNRANEMTLGLLDRREVGEYNDARFVEVSSTFVTQDAIFFGVESSGNL